MQRNFVHFIAAALFLTATFLGPLAKPASADVLGLVSLINNYRQSNGLSTLSEDQNLVNAACWLTADMATKNYFNHTDSLGRTMETRLTAFGVSGGFRAENIANLVNQPNSATKIFEMWKNSSGHNANMLDSNFSRVGVASSYRTENKTDYWVANFASGTVVAFNNQCGTLVNQAPTTPQPPAKPILVQPPATPKVNIEPPREVVQIATTTPSVESVIDEATKSATLSSRLVKYDNNIDDQQSPAVKLLGISTFLLANSFIIGFILWKLYRNIKYKQTMSAEKEKPVLD